jgi:hypothetical protein
MRLCSRAPKEEGILAPLSPDGFSHHVCFLMARARASSDKPDPSPDAHGGRAVMHGLQVLTDWTATPSFTPLTAVYGSARAGSSHATGGVEDSCGSIEMASGCEGGGCTFRRIDLVLRDKARLDLKY